MKPAVLKKFDKLMERSQEQIYRKKYEECLKTISEASALLKAEGDNSAEAWAWIYDARRYALFEAGRVDDAINECKTAISHLSKNGTWAYLSEHNHVRGTLRASHNMLAWTLAERADGEEGCLLALQHINSCLETIAPIEDKYTAVPFLETHAMVLHKLLKLSTKPHEYKTLFFVALAELVKRNPQALEGNADLKLESESVEFKEHLQNDPILKLCNTPAAESFEETLARYREALELAVKTDPDYAEYFAITFHEPLSDGQLRKLETSLGFPIPNALKTMALRNPIEVGSFSELVVLTEWKNRDDVPGLINYIDYAWGGRPEFEEYYQEKHRDYLNKNYFVFGMRYHDDNVHEYLYFDREGMFGSIVFDQDEFSQVQKQLNPLLKKSTANETLDQVISRSFSEVIKNKLLEQYLE